MRYKFPRQKRLLTERQIKKVFEKTRQKITNKFFNVYFCDNDQMYSRLGVIIPKKNINKATKRNSFKRVIREFFRLYQNKLKEKNDILVLVKKGSEKLSKKEMGLCLEKQLKELIGWEK